MQQGGTGSGGSSAHLSCEHHDGGEEEEGAASLLSEIDSNSIRSGSIRTLSSICTTSASSEGGADNNNDDNVVKNYPLHTTSLLPTHVGGFPLPHPQLVVQDDDDEGDEQTPLPVLGTRLPPTAKQKQPIASLSFQEPGRIGVGVVALENGQSAGTPGGGTGATDNPSRRLQEEDDSLAPKRSPFSSATAADAASTAAGSASTAAATTTLSSETRTLNDRQVIQPRVESKSGEGEVLISQEDMTADKLSFPHPPDFIAASAAEAEKATCKTLHPNHDATAAAATATAAAAASSNPPESLPESGVDVQCATMLAMGSVNPHIHIVEQAVLDGRAANVKPDTGESSVTSKMNGNVGSDPPRTTRPNVVDVSNSTRLPRCGSSSPDAPARSVAATATVAATAENAGSCAAFPFADIATDTFAPDHCQLVPRDATSAAPSREASGNSAPLACSGDDSESSDSNASGIDQAEIPDKNDELPHSEAMWCSEDVAENNAVESSSSSSSSSSTISAEAESSSSWVNQLATDAVSAARAGRLQEYLVVASQRDGFLSAVAPTAIAEANHPESTKSAAMTDSAATANAMEEKSPTTNGEDLFVNDVELVSTGDCSETDLDEVDLHTVLKNGALASAERQGLSHLTLASAAGLKSAAGRQVDQGGRSRELPQSFGTASAANGVVAAVEPSYWHPPPPLFISASAATSAKSCASDLGQESSTPKEVTALAGDTVASNVPRTSSQTPRPSPAEVDSSSVTLVSVEEEDVARMSCHQETTGEKSLSENCRPTNGTKYAAASDIPAGCAKGMTARVENLRCQIASASAENAELSESIQRLRDRVAVTSALRDTAATLCNDLGSSSDRPGCADYVGASTSIPAEWTDDMAVRVAQLRSQIASASADNYELDESIRKLRKSKTSEDQNMAQQREDFPPAGFSPDAREGETESFRTHPYGGRPSGISEPKIIAMSASGGVDQGNGHTTSLRMDATSSAVPAATDACCSAASALRGSQAAGAEVTHAIHYDKQHSGPPRTASIVVDASCPDDRLNRVQGVVAVPSPMFIASSSVRVKDKKDLAQASKKSNTFVPSPPMFASASAVQASAALSRAATGSLACFSELQDLSGQCNDDAQSKQGSGYPGRNGYNKEPWVATNSLAGFGPQTLPSSSASSSVVKSQHANTASKKVTGSSTVASVALESCSIAGGTASTRRQGDVLRDDVAQINCSNKNYRRPPPPNFVPASSVRVSGTEGSSKAFPSREGCATLTSGKDQPTSVTQDDLPSSVFAPEAPMFIAASALFKTPSIVGATSAASQNSASGGPTHVVTNPPPCFIAASAVHKQDLRPLAPSASFIAVSATNPTPQETGTPGIPLSKSSTNKALSTQQTRERAKFPPLPDSMLASAAQDSACPRREETASEAGRLDEPLPVASNRVGLSPPPTANRVLPSSSGSGAQAAVHHVEASSNSEDTSASESDIYSTDSSETESSGIDEMLSSTGSGCSAPSNSETIELPCPNLISACGLKSKSDLVDQVENRCSPSSSSSPQQGYWLPPPPLFISASAFEDFSLSNRRQEVVATENGSSLNPAADGIPSSVSTPSVQDTITVSTCEVSPSIPTQDHTVSRDTSTSSSTASSARIVQAGCEIPTLQKTMPASTSAEHDQSRLESFSQRESLPVGIESFQRRCQLTLSSDSASSLETTPGNELTLPLLSGRTVPENKPAAPSRPEPFLSSVAVRRDLIVLISSFLLSTDQKSQQTQAFSVLKDQEHIPFSTVDAADPLQAQQASKLMMLSGKHSYPQFFLGDVISPGMAGPGRPPTFWGDWNRFEESVTNGTILKDFGMVSPAYNNLALKIDQRGSPVEPEVGNNIAPVSHDLVETEEVQAKAEASSLREYLNSSSTLVREFAASTSSLFTSQASKDSTTSVRVHDVTLRRDLVVLVLHRDLSPGQKATQKAHVFMILKNEHGIPFNTVDASSPLQEERSKQLLALSGKTEPESFPQFFFEFVPVIIDDESGDVETLQGVEPYTMFWGDYCRFEESVTNGMILDDFELVSPDLVPEHVAAVMSAEATKRLGASLRTSRPTSRMSADSVTSSSSSIASRSRRSLPPSKQTEATRRRHLVVLVLGEDKCRAKENSQKAHAFMILKNENGIPFSIVDTSSPSDAERSKQLLALSGKSEPECFPQFFFEFGPVVIDDESGNVDNLERAEPYTVFWGDYAKFDESVTNGMILEDFEMMPIEDYEFSRECCREGNMTKENSSETKSNRSDVEDVAQDSDNQMPSKWSEGMTASLEQLRSQVASLSAENCEMVKRFQDLRDRVSATSELRDTAAVICRDMSCRPDPPGSVAASVTDARSDWTQEMEGRVENLRSQIAAASAENSELHENIKKLRDQVTATSALRDVTEKLCQGMRPDPPASSASVPVDSDSGISRTSSLAPKSLDSSAENCLSVVAKLVGRKGEGTSQQAEAVGQGAEQLSTRGDSAPAARKSPNSVDFSCRANYANPHPPALIGASSLGETNTLAPETSEMAPGSAAIAAALQDIQSLQDNGSWEERKITNTTNPSPLELQRMLVAAVATSSSLHNSLVYLLKTNTNIISSIASSHRASDTQATATSSPRLQGDNSFSPGAQGNANTLRDGKNYSPNLDSASSVVKSSMAGPCDHDSRDEPKAVSAQLQPGGRFPAPPNLVSASEKSGAVSVSPCTDEVSQREYERDSADCRKDTSDPCPTDVVTCCTTAGEAASTQRQQNNVVATKSSVFKPKSRVIPTTKKTSTGKGSERALQLHAAVVATSVMQDSKDSGESPVLWHQPHFAAVSGEKDKQNCDTTRTLPPSNPVVIAAPASTESSCLQVSTKKKAPAFSGSPMFIAASSVENSTTASSSSTSQSQVAALIEHFERMSNNEQGDIQASSAARQSTPMHTDMVEVKTIPLFEGSERTSNDETTPAAQQSTPTLTDIVEVIPSIERFERMANNEDIQAPPAAQPSTPMFADMVEATTNVAAPASPIPTRLAAASAEDAFSREAPRTQPRSLRHSIVPSSDDSNNDLVSAASKGRWPLNTELTNKLQTLLSRTALRLEESRLVVAKNHSRYPKQLETKLATAAAAMQESRKLVTAIAEKRSGCVSTGRALQDITMSHKDIDDNMGLLVLEDFFFEVSRSSSRDEDVVDKQFAGNRFVDKETDGNFGGRIELVCLLVQYSDILLLLVIHAEICLLVILFLAVVLVEAWQ